MIKFSMRFNCIVFTRFLVKFITFRFPALASPTTQIIGINRELLTFIGLQSIKPTPGVPLVKKPGKNLRYYTKIFTLSNTDCFIVFKAFKVIRPQKPNFSKFTHYCTYFLSNQPKFKGMEKRNDRKMEETFR
jgi:hypothetical protein